jgi:hypothetical protein
MLLAALGLSGYSGVRGKGRKSSVLFSSFGRGYRETVCPIKISGMVFKDSEIISTGICATSQVGILAFARSEFLPDRGMIFYLPEDTP